MHRNPGPMRGWYLSCGSHSNDPDSRFSRIRYFDLQCFMNHEREELFTQLCTSEDGHVLHRISSDFGDPFSRQCFLVELVRAPIEEPSLQISIAPKLDELELELGVLLSRVLSRLQLARPPVPKASFFPEIFAPSRRFTSTPKKVGSSRKLV